MGTVYAIANQKGGVGKTTTAVNLAACVAEAEYDALLVDVDPQCNATLGLGLPKDFPETVYDVLVGSATLEDIIRPTAIEHLWVAPAGPDLAGATVELPRVAGSETRLRAALEPVRERYAFVLLDCPPSLGPLTVNALVAADRVIVPVQAEYFALEGLAGLLDTLLLVQRELNPRLTVAGMLLTMHDGRTRLAQDVEREVREHFPELVFDTVIPRNVRIGEAPSFGKPVIHHDPHCAGADAYFELAKEVASRVVERHKGMGRGLAAILSVAPKDEPEELRQLPVELIAPNPRQPRGAFDEETLLSLADSIRLRGVLQPVLVRPIAGGHYELVAGERRWRAARLAELEMIPAVVRRHDDAASLEVALIENMAREDLNPIDEARACAALVEELGLTREEVGLRVGRSRVAVSNLIRLLDLPDEALALIERAELTEGHGRALLLAEDHAVRRRLAREAVTGRWSVRELESRARTAGAAPADRKRRSAGRAALHPDQLAAIEQIADALGEALGCEVDVSPAGRGYRAEVKLESLEDALDLARRLRVRAAA